jgi:hypothetical protein
MVRGRGGIGLHTDVAGLLGRVTRPVFSWIDGTRRVLGHRRDVSLAISVIHAVLKRSHVGDLSRLQKRVAFGAVQRSKT